MFCTWKLYTELLPFVEYLFGTTVEKTDLNWQKASLPITDFKRWQTLIFISYTTRPSNIFSLSLVIFWWQKLTQLWKILNWSLIAPIKKYRKIPNNFQRIPVWIYKAYTIPKNTGIPGFCNNTVSYRTRIKFLIPLGPGSDLKVE